MKAWLTMGLLIAVALTPAMAAAAEPESGEATADEADGSDNSQASTQPSTSPDIFIPTEEISEDFAVPFPVDI